MLFSLIASSRRILRISLPLIVLLSIGLIAARLQSASKLAIRTVSATAAPLAAGKPLPDSRAQHTTTLLPNGKVLVAGGSSDGSDAGATNNAFLYDPKTGDWEEILPMKSPRKGHFAVLLQSGKVLVGGGKNGGSFLSSSEIYDPASRMWTLKASMKKSRHRAAATLLAYASSGGGTSRNGFALAVGGETDGGAALDTAEFFDPVSETWKETTNKLSRPRVGHSATLLTSGDVLVAGGYSTASVPLTAADIYDPLTDKWRTTDSMKTARFGHSATLLTNGKVLIAGGIGANGAALNTAETFNASHAWVAETNKMAGARAFHSAALLPNGTLFVAGGFAGLQRAATERAEIYTPASSQWTSAGSFGEARGFHTATIMANARVLMIGGAPALPLSAALDSVEIHDPAVGKWLIRTNSMNVQRYDHTATLLSNGKVLIAGGRDFTGPIRSAEIYDPATDTWAPTADLNIARGDHTATLLRNGKVLVAGGSNSGGQLDSTELYDPTTGSWSLIADPMPNKRTDHSATLLADGRVLAVGGWNTALGTTTLKGCDVYDPITNMWDTARSLNIARRYHTTTLLFDGRALAVGGDDANALRTSELYDPVANKWSSQTESLMHVGHFRHTATLLPNGRVLIVSGQQGSGGSTTNFSGSANLFDLAKPANQQWGSVTPPAGRVEHTATLLPNGKVLIVGGYTIQSSIGGINNVDAPELYDPARGTATPFTETTKITFPRDAHTATLLPNGRVLIAGGRTQVTSSNGSLVEVLVDKVELYDVGLNAVPTVAPAFIATTWNGSGNPVCATGIRFQGGGEAAGGNSTGSNANYPVIQLMRLDNQQTYFLTPDPNSTQCSFKGWSNNSYASMTVPETTPAGTINNLAKGISMMTVFVNGVPSARAMIQAPGAVTPGGSSPLANLTGRIYTVADSGLQVNVELRSSTGEVRNVLSGPNGEYIFEDLPTQTAGTSAGSVSPNQITEDSSSTPITVTGSGFAAGSQIVFNGVALQTTVVSSTELRATVPANLLQNDGYASVVVRSANGGTTSPLTVRIVPPAASDRPVINSLSPATTTAGVNPGSIAINGTNLLNGNTQVLWNGQARPIVAAQSTATRLVFTTSTSDVAQAGTASVQVQNGGGLSNVAPFTISAQAKPVITSLNPSSIVIGTPLSQIAIIGTSLLNPTGTTDVLWNGLPRPIIANLSSATQLIFAPQTFDLVEITVATVTARHRSVTPSGEVLMYSNTVNFTFIPIPRPTISSLTPPSISLPVTNVNSIPAQPVGVIGSNFASNSIARINGGNVATSFVSSARLNFNIPGNLIATQTSLNISVLNPSNNLTSNVVAFPINPPPTAQPGSALAYPLYSTSCTTVGCSTTTISITNNNSAAAVRVRFFFIEGLTGIATNSIQTIQANQTLTLPAASIPKSQTGYVIAVAVNNNNCPIVFNSLTGSEFVFHSSGYAGSVSAVPIRGFVAPTPCSSLTSTTVLNFDGAAYDRFPSQLTMDNVVSATANNSALAVVNTVGGNLGIDGRASTLGSLFGVVVDSTQNSYSFVDFRSSSQIVAELNTQFPRTTPRLDQLLPPNQPGKITVFGSTAVFGMIFTRTIDFSRAAPLRTVAVKNQSLSIPVNQSILNFSGETLNSASEPVSSPTVKEGLSRVSSPTVKEGLSRVSSPTVKEGLSRVSSPTVKEGLSRVSSPTVKEGLSRVSSPTVKEGLSDGAKALANSLSTDTAALQQQPGAAISYTITPSGNISTGDPIEFLPASRTVTLGGGATSFTAIAAEPSQTVDASFCGRTAPNLKIRGGVTMQTAYVSESVQIGLRLTNEKAPGCSLPTDITTTNSAGSYIVENSNPATRVLGLEGSYQITPADSRFEFHYQPAGQPESAAGTYLAAPLTNENAQQLSLNFNAYAVAACPASITATANGETNLQICEGQQINLETPTVPGATSYTWTLPSGTMIAGRTPSIAGAMSVNTGTYRVQVATPACAVPVQTTIQVTVNPAAIAQAGPDQSVCKNPNGTTVFTLAGTGSAGATVIWTAIGSTGDAVATINDIGSLTSTVGVAGTGSVTLQLTTASPAGCGIANDTVVLNVTTGSTSITAQPQAQSVCLSAAASFSVAASGAGLSYQWRKNGANIPGQTAATLSIPAAQISDAGTYDVVVTGSGCAAVTSAAVALAVNSYEADLTPIPNGDCQLTMADWVRVGNIISGNVTGLSAAELQRADCSPRNAFGNGILSISDWVQTGRYAAGLDPLVLAGGPSVTAPAFRESSAYSLAQDTQPGRTALPGQARTLRLRTENLRAPSHTIEIELEARGEENAAGFSLNFPPGSWRLQSAKLSDELDSATLLVNRSQAKAGRLGFVVSLPFGQKLPSGKHRIAKLRFSPMVSVTKTAELAAFNFGDSPVSRELVDANAEALPLNFARDDYAPLTVVSAADFAQQKLAIESIAVAFGEKLAAHAINAETLPLPVRLSDTQVIVIDSRGVEHFAPLFSASTGQVVFLVPPDAALGYATVAIRNSDNQFSATSVEIVESAPAIFVDCGLRIADCGLQSAALPVAMLLRAKPDGELNYEPLWRNDSASKRLENSPIEFVENDQLILVLFGTGFRHHRGEITARLGDTTLPVLYAGAQNEMTGLDQINLTLPRWLAGSGERTLWLTINGQPTNQLRIVFK